MTTPKNQYWKSLEHLENSEAFQDLYVRAFPEEHQDASIPVSRRDFLRFMGASVALAGATGCRRPVEHIVPYVRQPEEIIPGVPLRYATTITTGEEAVGVVVESHEGRPTKIEGNPLHPGSGGGANSLHQASILNLYDPDRIKRSPDTWSDFLDFWRDSHGAAAAAGGAALAVISEASCSPSLTRLKSAFKKAFPAARWATYEAVSDETVHAGVEAATGKRQRLRYHYDRASVVVALDADFLLCETDNVANSRGFAEQRRIRNRGGSMNRLYSVESAFTVTGAMADHRLRLRSADIMAFAETIARRLADHSIAVPGLDALGHGLTPVDDTFVTALVSDLVANKGKSLLVAGRRQPAEVHALVYSLNAALNNIGSSVSCIAATDRETPDLADFAALVREMASGKVNTVIILDGNPVFNAPADLNFTDAMKAVENSVHLSSIANETTQLADWHIRKSHYLESWGDARAGDGTLSLVQPLIAPLGESRSTIELLYLLVHGKEKSGFETVRETWKAIIRSGDFERTWRKVLHDGVLAGSALPESSPSVDLSSLTALLKARARSGADTSGVEAVFLASPAVYDGRFANNAWLQELPDTMTKLVWDNAAVMSPSTAEKFGIDRHRHDGLKPVDHHMIRITANGRSIELPIFLLPGHADDSISVYLGYGRRDGGRVANGVGVNTYTLRTLNAPNFVTGVQAETTGEMYKLSTTQNHHSMEGRPLIRETSLAAYRDGGELHPALIEGPPLKSLWKDHNYSQGNQWGMTVDLNLCTGCNACVIACQSENNIPVVGKKDAGYGRELHWIRIDRYFSGDENNPQAVHQPIPCMHCENAPCEQVCPVQATNHDKSGLNVMVYNRCIGTRYCSNNCPFKVRRFNFFNYTKATPESAKMANNPDVTVRSRGVMEKCTYCLQRINESRIKAKLDGKPLRDGDVVTACEQTCPVDAIVFGDIADPQSRVSVAKSQDRNYVLVGEINVRPRTSYLGKLRNPHPTLAAATPAEHHSDAH